MHLRGGSGGYGGANGAAADGLSESPRYGNPLQLPPDKVPPYLRRYGYPAADDGSWTTPPTASTGSSSSGAAPGTGRPSLALEVVGHEEIDGHTCYCVECAIDGPWSTRLVWRAKRRLKQLREGLHDGVKALLSTDAYEQHFGAAPFAHRGGLPGTTARLRCWCAALASYVTSGDDCPLALAALTLRFFEAPSPPTLTSSARSAATGVASRMRDGLENARRRLDDAKDSARQRAADASTAAALGFAKDNPNLAKKGSGLAASMASSNPELAKSLGKSAGSAGLGFAMKNPKMAMQVAKTSAKAAMSFA